VQRTVVIGPPERMEARLAQAVPQVLHDEKGLAEKHLFRFGLADAVLVIALASVSVVPLNPWTSVQSIVQRT
jgi:hypothetical protein